MEYSYPGNYPDTEGISKNIEYAKLLLNCYAGKDGEIATTLMYIYEQNFCNESAISEALEKIVEIDQKHIKLLGKCILSLGIDPKYYYTSGDDVKIFSAAKFKYPTKVEELLLTNIKHKENSIEEYKLVLSKIQDSKVKQLIARIILDEKVHLKVLKDLYENVNDKEVETINGIIEKKEKVGKEKEDREARENRENKENKENRNIKLEREITKNNYLQDENVLSIPNDCEFQTLDMNEDQNASLDSLIAESRYVTRKDFMMPNQSMFNNYNSFTSQRNTRYNKSDRYDRANRYNDYDDYEEVDLEMDNYGMEDNDRNIKTLNLRQGNLHLSNDYDFNNYNNDCDYTYDYQKPNYARRQRRKTQRKNRNRY